MNAQDVRHVGVVGCGLMGSGIVEVCARAGLRVTFAEGSADLIEAGRARIARSLDGAVAKRKAGRRRRATPPSGASMRWTTSPASRPSTW